MSHYDPTAAIPSWGIWGNLRHVIGDLADRTTNRGVDVTLPPYNAVGDGVADDTAAIQQAIDDADAAGVSHSNNHNVAAPGRTLTVYVPPGTYLTRGVVLDGRNVNLVGAGPAATRFRAHPDIEGFVVSMNGWTGGIAHHRGSGPFGNFSVEGTHQADPSKAQGGLHIASTQVHMENVSVFGTGGPAIRVDPGVFLSHFYRIMCQRPVGADINDVPYLHVFGDHNGNVWERPMFRSVSSDDDAVSGVMVFERDTGAEFPTQEHASQNAILYPWVEFPHIPAGGSLFRLETQRTLLESPQIFDQNFAATGAEDWATVRIIGVDNQIHGDIPSRSPSQSIGYGIYIDGSGNRVVGRRGYSGYNVYLAVGSNYNYVEFGGLESTNLVGPPFVDDSADPSNTLIDHNEKIRVPSPSVTGATDTDKVNSLIAALTSLGLITDNTT